MERTVLSPSSITVPEDRQRGLDEGHARELAFKIKARGGLLHPITVEEGDGTYILVAGLHRLYALREILSWEEIPVTILSKTSPIDLTIIEYEENAARKSLDWKEDALAVRDIHEKLNQTVEDTAALLGVSDQTISRKAQVGRYLTEGHEKVLEAASLSAAYSIVDKIRRRAADKEMSDFIERGGGVEAMSELLGGGSDDTSSSSPTLTPEMRERLSIQTMPASETIIEADAFAWIKDYDGPKFDFVHADPPYGINHDRSEQGRAQHHGAYADSPDLFWAFVHEIFNGAFFSKMAPQAHVMLWYSMNYHTDLIEYISSLDHAWRINPFPLIWFKSDSTGILPDPERGPRRVYETALMASVGDRKIHQAVNNLFAHPANKREAEHLSEKPTIMLRHFFRMFISEAWQETIMLDICSGGGSAMRAAEVLGAHPNSRALEQNPEHVEGARSRLNILRAKIAEGGFQASDLENS